MCIRAVIARCSGEQIQHATDPLDGGFTSDPATLRSNDDRHDSEAGSTDGGLVVRCICTCTTPVWCKAADGMTPVPEKLESLALHDVEQLLIGQFGQRCSFHGLSHPVDSTRDFALFPRTYVSLSDGIR
jgi:hypothetical protein